MPGREKDRTMRTVSSPLIRVRVEWLIAYGTVPGFKRKTMDSSNTEEGLDDTLVVRRHSLWQKNQINKYLWQFVVDSDLRRAWTYKEKNLSLLTKSFISRRLGEPSPVAPVMMKWDDILCWISSQEVGKTSVDTDKKSSLLSLFRHSRRYYLKRTSQISEDAFDEAFLYPSFDHCNFGGVRFTRKGVYGNRTCTKVELEGYRSLWHLHISIWSQTLRFQWG